MPWLFWLPEVLPVIASVFASVSIPNFAFVLASELASVLAPVLVLLFFLAGACWMDMKSGRVPNQWSALFWFAGLYFFPDVRFAFAGLLALSVSYLLWRRHVWGSGDAKFFTVLSSWGLVFRFSADFPLVLFVLTGLWAAAWRLKTPASKFFRLPGAPLMGLAFLTWLVVDRLVARTIQH